jgi:hypothetical protein
MRNLSITRRNSAGLKVERKSSEKGLPINMEETKVLGKEPGPFITSLTTMLM